MEGSGRGSSADVVLQNYKIGKTLGIGSFGKVKIAEHLLTGHKVAIKILNRRKIKSMEMEEKVRREIKILRLFMHPHIIRLYEVIETHSDIYVVTEYVKAGELFDYIVEKGRLQEVEARRFFQQIISGVEYCHRNMVAHRDLKPENLLLDSKCNVKIADFGLSNVMRDGHFLKTSCGSPNYAAPEVISGKLYAGPEVDVWSCGVILYALLCGTLPFDDENIPNLFKKIKGGIYTLPSHLSALARDLIPKMLVVDPMKRITIPQIREHAWFKIRLPRYLAVPPSDTSQQAKKIDEDILLEVTKMGFDKNQLVESLHNRIQNEATVSYYLLVDNRFRATSGYLGGDFQETMDYLNPNSSEMAAPHRQPGYMEQQGINPRAAHSPASERKWALGLQSRAHPREIMTEVLKALQELNISWKQIGHYNMKCRYFPGFADSAGMLNNESATVETEAADKEPLVIKFEMQLYKTREDKYLLDLQRLSGPQLLFLNLCAAFLAQLRVL
ncbi:SNF1-related protein kinase catalytic subunit alpha KIN10-like [Curcuma longa]|uniref:SNF1-related protein kinase catalytic subunit alpha KIN10-like n=1 Tax=Curcuma longa TaxID=136217 RepID=UPI003D9E369B